MTLTKDEKKARDEAICRFYLNDGKTQEQLAGEFGISEAWVGRILFRAGLTPKDRPKATRRNAATGVHLSKGVKEAVRKLATDEEKSMSAWLAGVVSEELKRRGVTVEEDSALSEINVKLPFEETPNATAH